MVLPRTEHPSDNNNRSSCKVLFSVCSWHFAETPLFLPETTAYHAFSSDILRSSGAPVFIAPIAVTIRMNQSTLPALFHKRNICTFPSALPVPVWKDFPSFTLQLLTEKMHMYVLLYLYALQSNTSYPFEQKNSSPKILCYLYACS